MKRIFALSLTFLLFCLVGMAQKFEAKDYIVQTGPLSLPATLLANGDKAAPIVVFVHGSGPNDRDETLGPNKLFRSLADSLAVRGIASLRYDKRTMLYKGGADTLTYREETVDDAVQAVRQLHEAGYTHIFLAGHSLGGHLAPLIAETAAPMLSGVIILSGNVSNIQSAIESQLHYLGRQQGASEAMIRQSIDQMLAALPARYRQYDEAYAPQPVVRRLLAEHPSLRWLIVQGGHDYQVTMADYYMWQRMFGPRATYCYGPTLDHILRSLPAMARPQDYMNPGEIDTKVISALSEFINTKP